MRAMLSNFQILLSKFDRKRLGWVFFFNCKFSKFCHYKNSCIVLKLVPFHKNMQRAIFAAYLMIHALIGTICVYQ